jgi:HAD superfamily hydrolase (TIGR01458 family)
MITGVLLDLGGVVFVGDEPIPGAIDALSELRASGIAVRFLTNTTRQPLREMLEKLHELGIRAAPEELFMPASAAQRFLRQHNLTPLLLVHPRLMEDFDAVPAGKVNAVVVGDAAENFTYAKLNLAYRVLSQGAEFLALARNRGFRDEDGDLSLDAGPFVAALEYATGRDATVLGKPSATFFREAIASIGRPQNQIVMIG